MKVEDLLKQVSKNDKSAFKKLYSKTFKLVYATVYSVLKNSHDSEDVTAEVYVTLWNKADSYNGGKGTAYVCAIAKNHALTFLKKREREQTIITEEYSFGSYTINDRVESKEELIVALNNLSEKEREVVLIVNAGYKQRNRGNARRTFGNYYLAI